MEKAKNLGIELNCYTESFKLSFMKDIDLTTIIANLLDNAIDEVKEISEKKEIFFKINIFNNFLVINTKNALRNKPIKINEGFKTTKKNHQGLGLENVKITIEKYDGDLRIEFDENYFKVNIVIPLPME